MSALLLVGRGEISSREDEILSSLSRQKQQCGETPSSYRLTPFLYSLTKGAAEQTIHHAKPRGCTPKN